MNYLTTVVHKTVLRYKLEPVFFLLSYVDNFFLKFIPLPKFYKRKDRRITVKREGVYFQLDRSDYMQWHIYARQPDESWKKAPQYLRDHTTWWILVQIVELLVCGWRSGLLKKIK